MRALLSAPPRWLLVAVAIAINAIWALSYPVSKLVLTDMSVGALSCWRLAGAALLLAPFLTRRELPRRPSAKDGLLLAVMGLAGCAAPVFLQYIGTVRTSASNVSLIVGLEPVLVVLLAALWLKEALRPRAWVGLAAAFMGVGLISVDPTTLDLLTSSYWQGNALMLLAVVGFASYTVAGKPLAGRFGATALTVLPFVLGAAVTLPLYGWIDPAGFMRGLALSPAEGLGVFFLVGLGTAFSYLCWNWLLNFVPASKLAYSLYLQPVAGAGFSAWLLGETLSLTFLLGAALILVAMAVGMAPERPRPGGLGEQPLPAAS